ncbi:MAG: EamA family transporter [Acidobacteria bacterium]|nr:EamA family transporter [Acidobacteriota bacterium]
MDTDYRLLTFSGLTILLWGLWGFFGKLALERKMAPTSMFLAEILISAACAIPVALFLFRKQDTVPFFSSWNVFGLISGAALALGLLFYYLALERGQVSIIVPLTAAYPAVTVLLGYAVLGERPGMMRWVGVVLVIIGALLLLSDPAAMTSRK